MTLNETQDLEGQRYELIQMISTMNEKINVRV